MPIKYERGDMFETLDKCLVHGCNSYGVMGSGVAATWKKLYPQSFKEYAAFCAKANETVGRHKALGYNVVTEEAGKVLVCAITQESMGHDGKRYVSYDAIDSCFEKIANDPRIPNNITIPQIGAGLGGGDWRIIETILSRRLAETKNVTVWIYDPNVKCNYDPADPEHVRVAKYWIARKKPNGDLYLKQDKRTGGYYVSERVYACVEVDWTWRFVVNSHEEARDLVARGLVTPWMDTVV